MLPFGRMHLFELEDQPWFPDRWRDWALDHLGFLEEQIDAYGAVVPIIEDLLRQTGSRRVVDLCSGSGAAPASLKAALEARGMPCEVVLTDLYPNLVAFRAREEQGLRHIAEPVDATRVPEALTGVRTLFNAFHHMPEEAARAILADAAARGQPIVIVETVRRSARALAMVGVIAAGAFAVAPFVRPRSLGRLACTYVVPVVPFTVLFDGLVSCVRVYSPDELTALVRDITPREYTFQASEVPLGALPWSLSVYVGRPVLSAHDGGPDAVGA